MPRKRRACPPQMRNFALRVDAPRLATQGSPLTASAPVACRLFAVPRLAAFRGQLDNAKVSATEPPAELAVDVLQHHRIRVDVGFIEGVEVSGRELVEARLGCQ